jgi:mannose-6-phosphate isomerase-like protein (cupin superfamily)
VSRAVVDLRAYAAGTEPARDWLGGRKTPAFADAAAQVAALAPRGEGRVDALGADEFVIVLTGRLDLEVRGEAMAVETGQSAVLPVGSSFGWRASEDTLLVIASAAADTPGTQTAPVLIDETAELTPPTRLWPNCWWGRRRHAAIIPITGRRRASLFAAHGIPRPITAFRCPIAISS